MSSPRSGERVAPASPPSLMRRPRGVLFDLGGTLLQLESFDVEAGTEPADTWYVGDHVEFDVAGAASAGMVPILYAPQAALVAHEADLEVARWSELSARLRAL